MENGNVKSSLQYIVCGVQQGYMFGPLLFMICMNDICNVRKIMKFVIFADVTNILTSKRILLNYTVIQIEN